MSVPRGPARVTQRQFQTGSGYEMAKPTRASATRETRTPPHRVHLDAGIAQARTTDQSGNRTTRSSAVPTRCLRGLGIDSPVWQKFVKAQPSSTIFQHPAWAQLLASCYGFHPFVLAVIDGRGQIEAGLPLLEVTRPVGPPRWISLPFTDHCVPLALTTGALGDLVEGLVRIQSTYPVAQIEIHTVLGSHLGVSSRSSAVLHHLTLPSSPDQVYAKFSEMHRRNIRKAERAGVVITIDCSLAAVREFYRLHVETRRRQGVPVQPWSFFHLLWQHVISANLGFVALACSGSTCIAASVFLTWNGTQVYKYGASDVEHLSLRPNNLLFWTAIRWGCDHGYHTFDWGRTDYDNAGLRDFKNGWGAREEALIYSTIGSAPGSLGDGIWRRLAGKTLPGIIHHSPPVICRLLGQMLYRYAA